jgi:uncharacterized membrane protein
MRAFVLAIALALLAVPAAYSQPADTSSGVAPPVRGLWLTTSYPEQTVHAGGEISLDLSLRNKGLPPQRVALSVAGAPAGWKSEIDGAGTPVTAAFAEPDDTTALTLKLTPPSGVKAGEYHFKVLAKGDTTSSTLPLTLRLSNGNSAKLVLQSELPALRGSSSAAFKFNVTVKNEGGQDATVSLTADAPPGFQTAIKEQYGQQELSSVPIKAGKSKELALSVTPPHDVAAGHYNVAFHAATAKAEATTKLAMDITGQPALTLLGPGGRLSGNATAGDAATVTMTLQNNGTAPAHHVSLTASAPRDWKTSFSPKEVATLAPNATQQVTATITPAAKAIAGDYVVTMNAAGQGAASASADYRVTVSTSTLWGIIGIAIIAAALIALSLAVMRFGRR